MMRPEFTAGPIIRKRNADHAEGGRESTRAGAAGAGAGALRWACRCKAPLSAIRDKTAYFIVAKNPNPGASSQTFRLKNHGFFILNHALGKYLQAQKSTP
jgi:hypothetical protein